MLFRSGRERERDRERDREREGVRIESWQRQVIEKGGKEDLEWRG